MLVIGFGVGNTTHAATLHPSVRRVDVADLSRHVLAHAGYFRDANADVLNDRRVSVYVNDGRQHLHMQPAASYDLIALEPPPIAHAGVGALYSREFYALARTRLKPGGYISQWLPAYQVPAAATLAMVRAFVEIFPQAVLLSGAKADLLLVGTNDAAIEIDPDRWRLRSRALPPCKRICSGSISAPSARSSARLSARPAALPTRAATRLRSPMTGRSGIQRPVAAEQRPTCSAAVGVAARSQSDPGMVPAVLRRWQPGSARRRDRHVSGAARSVLLCAGGRRLPAPYGARTSMGAPIWARFFLNRRMSMTFSESR